MMQFLLRGRLARLFYRLVSNLGWREIILFVIGHCFTSWLLHRWAEPGAEYVQFDTFWYYYFISATTIGYGDFSPTTFAGRFFTVFYIGLPGIALVGVVIGKIGAIFVNFADKLKRGLMQLHVKNHIIVVGDGTPHTVSALRNLIEDPSVCDVVLVSTRAENPLNGQLTGFVSGDINDADVQKRACFQDATTVIVLGDNDAEVTGRTITAIDCSGEETCIVAYFQHGHSARRLNSQTGDRVRTVSSVSMDLVVQEALDPGAADFFWELTKNTEGGTYLRLTVPDGVETTWAQLGYQLSLQDVNLLAYYVGEDPDTIPKGSTPVKTGDCISVAAENRAALDQIDWNPLRQL